MKAEHEVTVSYKVEVEHLERDPLTGFLVDPRTINEFTHYVLAELPFIQSVHNRCEGELSVTEVRLYKKHHDGTWLMQYQWKPDEKQLAVRLEQHRKMLDRVTEFRTNAQPGDAASLADLMKEKKP